MKKPSLRRNIRKRTIPYLVVSLLSTLAVISHYASSQSPEPEPNPASNESQSQSNEAPEKTKIDVEKNKNKLLSETFEDDDLRWLEGIDGQFMALWEWDKTGNPFGAVLILHGAGQSLAWPYTINALRHNLSLHGWATLTISMPPLKGDAIPPRSTPKPTTGPKPTAQKNEGLTNKNDDGSTQDSSSEAIKITAAPNPTQPSSAVDPEAISHSRITAAIDFLKQQGQYNIVIASQGIAGLRAASYIDSLLPEEVKKKIRMNSKAKVQRPIRAFVLIAARNQHHSYPKEITDYFNDPGLPIMDVVFGNHYLDESEAKNRKLAAKKSDLDNYYQHFIVPPYAVSDSHENELTRRVRGFLNENAKGVELERR